MKILSIPITSDTPYKIMTFNVEIGGSTKRFRMEIRHLNYTDKWYISIFDAQTGKSYCRYIPIVSSYSELNDLIRLFRYKDIGWMCCMARRSDPSTVDPQEYSINEFELYWGDELGR